MIFLMAQQMVQEPGSPEEQMDLPDSLSEIMKYFRGRRMELSIWCVRLRVWRQRERKERKRERESRKRTAAVATSPHRIDKPGAQNAVWNNFSF